MQVGDAIEYETPEDSSVLLVGEITAIEGGQATFVESHAFHRTWGGSSGGRGNEHTVDLSDLKPSRYTGIVRQWPAEKARAWGKKHGKIS